MSEPTGREFREILRTLTVTYPIPFVFAVLLGFALGCGALALRADGPLLWVFASLMVAAFGSGVGLVALAAWRRPMLLRSERHALSQRVLEIAADGDNDMDPASRERLVAEAMREAKRANEAASRRRLPPPATKGRKGSSDG